MRSRWIKWISISLLIGIVSGIVGYFCYRGGKGEKIEKQIIEAEQLYKEGEYRGALSILLSIYPKVKGENLPYVTSLIARIYFNLAEQDKAGMYCVKLTKLPDAKEYLPEALYNLGVIADMNGDWNVAKNYYKRIVEEFPESAFIDEAWFNLNKIYQREGKLIEAKKILEELVEHYPDSNLIENVMNELYNLNIKILFSPIIDEWSQEYIVQKGDALIGIAKKFGTTVDLLKKCNNIKGNLIHPGDKLKVVKAKFSILVDVTRNTLTLKADEKVVKVYPIGTGVRNSTPLGNFKIINKIMNPPWFKKGEGIIPYGDPRNILGTRWMGLDISGYGIHGTWDNSSIGKQSSAGCIRMKNEDVEELFQLVPVGTPVVVTE